MASNKIPHHARTGDDEWSIPASALPPPPRPVNCHRYTHPYPNRPIDTMSTNTTMRSVSHATLYFVSVQPQVLAAAAQRHTPTSIAPRAGLLHDGDLIHAVDGVPLNGASPADALCALAGAPGSLATLDLRRHRAALPVPPPPVMTPPFRRLSVVVPREAPADAPDSDVAGLGILIRKVGPPDRPNPGPPGPPGPPGNRPTRLMRARASSSAGASAPRPLGGKGGEGAPWSDGRARETRLSAKPPDGDGALPSLFSELTPWPEERARGGLATAPSRPTTDGLSRLMRRVKPPDETRRGGRPRRGSFARRRRPRGSPQRQAA